MLRRQHPKILAMFIDKDCASGELPFRDTPALTALIIHSSPAIDITTLHWKVHPIARGAAGAQGFHGSPLSRSVRPPPNLGVLTLSP